MGHWRIGLSDAYGNGALLILYRKGRRLVFALSLIGLILGAMWDVVVMANWKVLPIRLAWLSPVFGFLGGGESVANMVRLTLSRR